MSQQQHRDAKIDNVLCASGEETGIYYIPVGNLEFGTTWQQLKDFTRQVCDVDHVEVFPQSTCGWVRVFGHENFVLAYNHLQGGILNERVLQADGRNEKFPVPVRDLKLPRSPVGSASRSPTLSRATMRSSSFAQPESQQPSPLLTDGKHTVDWSYLPSIASMTSPMAGVIPRFSYSGVQYAPTMGLPYMPAVPYDYSNPIGPLDYTPRVTATVDYSYPNSQDDAATQDYQEYLSGPGEVEDDYYAPRSEDTQDVVYTESRKIIIRQLTRDIVSDSHIRKLVIKHVSPDMAAEIVHIDIPRDSGGWPRSHAFVLFTSPYAAICAVKFLNGVEVSGRTLEVRTTVEGMPQVDSTPTPPPDKWSLANPNHNSGKSRWTKKDKDKERERGSGWNGSSRPAGSSFYPPPPPPEKTERDKERKKSIVIADGSSTRKSTADKKRR